MSLLILFHAECVTARDDKRLGPTKLTVSGARHCYSIRTKKTLNRRQNSSSSLQDGAQAKAAGVTVAQGQKFSGSDMNQTKRTVIVRPSSLVGVKARSGT